jgi:hypothetical protein
LSAEEKQDAATRLGTTPYTVEEWKQMLVKAGAVPQIVEDWSGLENASKIRPGFKWNPNNPLDVFTLHEKVNLLPRLISKYGIGAMADLARSLTRIMHYVTDGYQGYALIIATRPPGA